MQYGHVTLTGNRLKLKTTVYNVEATWMACGIGKGKTGVATVKMRYRETLYLIRLEISSDGKLNHVFHTSFHILLHKTYFSSICSDFKTTQD